MKRSGHKRWRVGRLAFGFGWDLDGLTLPRLYRYRDQPECFGLSFAPGSADDFFSLDFEWTWRESDDTSSPSSSKSSSESRGAA